MNIHEETKSRFLHENFKRSFLFVAFTNHCARCSPRADCIDNFCFCKPGYYGNGNDCWPNTDPML